MSDAEQTPSKPKLPGTYRQFCERFPDSAAAHDAMGEAAQSAGPLNKQQQALVRIGISLGAGLESAIKSHVRRAREAGVSEAEIEQAILLAMTTVGFPKTVAAWSWARQQFERDARESSAE